MSAVSILASQPHYFHHLAPVWEALPEPARGPVVVTSGAAQLAASRYGIDSTRHLGALGAHVLVAGGVDALRVPYHEGRSIAHLDHGAGQTYHGDPSHPVDSYGYAGGPDLGRVALFVCASPRVADAWRARYPGASTLAVGPCSLTPNLVNPPIRADGWRAPGTRTVALTFHWPCTLVAECGSAADDWLPLLGKLAESMPVLGHAHPRWGDRLRRRYEALGITPVEWWPDVVDSAAVLIADNTSVMYEWAAMGRPVLALNARRWRREVEHGLRFWDAIPGPDFNPSGAGPEDLVLAANQARLAPSSWGWLPSGRLAAQAAYGDLADGRAPERAAQALLDWSTS